MTRRSSSETPKPADQAHSAPESKAGRSAYRRDPEVLSLAIATATAYANAGRLALELNNTITELHEYLQLREAARNRGGKSL